MVQKQEGVCVREFVCVYNDANRQTLLTGRPREWTLLRSSPHRSACSLNSDVNVGLEPRLEGERMD